jgi:hypothetical protein
MRVELDLECAFAERGLGPSLADSWRNPLYKTIEIVGQRHPGWDERWNGTDYEIRM